MKLSKAIILTSTILGLGLSTTLGFTQSLKQAKADEDELSILPNSVTSSIYRYAKAIGESHSDVDNALLEWLNATDNLSYLPIFENEPATHDATSNRAVKDGFYTLAYLQEYLQIGPTNVKDTNFTPSLTMLDFCMSKIDDVTTFISSENNDEFVDAYNSCKNLYQYVYDSAYSIGTDVYKTYFEPVEAFIKSAKQYLQNGINRILDIGFDESLNPYFKFKLLLDSFGKLYGKNSDLMDAHSTELLDYILFDENTHIDTYNSREFIDFTLDQYNTAIGEASGDEEVQEISAPYIEKLDRQLLACLITYQFALSYFDNGDALSAILHNCGPSFYKLVDYAWAKQDADAPNIVILCFNVLEDIDTIFGELGIDTNKKDLRYEKYIASMCLGSLVYKNNTFLKFAKFLDNMETINEVSEATFEQGVAKINELVLEGYKDINVDIIPTSDQAVLFFANGLEDLASREQGYTFEIRKMLNHDHAIPIETKFEDDYGDNLLYTNVVWIDMVLVDDKTGEELKSLDDPLEVTFGIYNLQIGTDINVYRYDEATEKAVTLSNTETPSGTDYFTVNIDDVSVHTKDFGTYAIVWINRLVKEEVENFRSTITDLEDQVTSMADTIEELETDISDLESQVSALNAQIASKDAKITELQSKISELEGKITLLEADINDKQAQITSLTAQLAAKDITITELTTKVAALEADIESKKATITSLQNELNDVKATLAEKIVQISDLETTVKNKNTLCIVFIVLACVFAASTVTFSVLYFVKKNKKEDEE